jgi:hypothetical protein
VIIVGRNVLAAAADKRAEATYAEADAVLHEAVEIQVHLAAQDKVLDAPVTGQSGVTHVRREQSLLGGRLCDRPPREPVWFVSSHP